MNPSRLERFCAARERAERFRLAAGSRAGKRDLRGCGGCKRKMLDAMKHQAPLNPEP